jgi:magnesium transporter
MTTAARRPPFGKRYHTPGTAPGTLRPLENPRTQGVRMTVIDYGPDHFEEKTVERVEDLAPYRDKESVTWINIEGLNDIPLLEALGQAFGIHPLTLEDMLNCGQRAKLEDYGGYHFIVVKSLRVDEDDGLETEQISFILSEGFVITVQEIPGDSFEAVRERLRKGKGRIRSFGPDYLAYALIDALVDEFFPVLERYGERLENLEDIVVQRATPEVLNEIHQIKRDLLMVRRIAFPEREVINALQREGTDLISDNTRVFLRDCYDHIIQVIDMVETYRDLAGGLLDVYLSSVSNRMNEIMKVLTIISTIFIPLNFIAGLYGMNFNREVSRFNMPELDWPYGYPAVLCVMLTVAVGLLLYFRRKRWL